MEAVAMFDLILLAIIGISALLGLMRGFVGIVVGAASWLLSRTSRMPGPPSASWDPVCC